MASFAMNTAQVSQAGKIACIGSQKCVPKAFSVLEVCKASFFQSSLTAEKNVKPLDSKLQKRSFVCKAEGGEASAPVFSGLPIDLRGESWGYYSPLILLCSSIIELTRRILLKENVHLSLVWLMIKGSGGPFLRPLQKLELRFLWELGFQ